MLNRRIIMTLVAPAPLALAFAACAAQAQSPQAATERYNRGIALAQRRDFDWAIAEFDKAFELNHRFAEAYANRGKIRYDIGDVDGALTDYDKAIKYGANSSSAPSSGSYLVSASNPVLAMACNNRGIVYRDKSHISLFPAFLFLAAFRGLTTNTDFP